MPDAIVLAIPYRCGLVGRQLDRLMYASTSSFVIAPNADTYVRSIFCADDVGWVKWWRGTTNDSKIREFARLPSMTTVWVERSLNEPEY